MKVKLLIIVLNLYSLLSIAQNTINGRVNGSNGDVLIGATVFIPELNKGTITDNSGFYDISGLANGKVNVVFSFLGHSNHIETVYLNGASTELNVVLTPSAIETEAVVISGGYSSSQHQNAVKIDVLKMNDQIVKPTPNFAKSLTDIPGVDMISKGNGVSKPVIRGLSMNDILILNNGVRFENYQYSNHHPLGIDEFGIENVEVVKGPASLLYGSDAIGGVINFIKESPAPIGSIVGDYNLQMHSGSNGIVNNLGFKGSSNNFFGGFRFGQKSHADYLQGGGDFVPNSRFNEHSLKTNFGYVGQKVLTKLFYDYNQQNLGLVEDEAIEQIINRGRKNEIFYQRLKTHLVSSQSKLFLGKNRVEFNVSFQNTELIHFGEKDAYELQMRLGTLIYESKFFLSTDSNADFIFGFQGINQQNMNLNNRETILLPNASSNGFSGFIFGQKLFWERLKVQAGIRYDLKSIDSKSVGEPLSSEYRPMLSKQYSSFSGSLGGTYRINDDLLFRLNGASAFRNPNLAELTSNGLHEAIFEVGDANLVPEKSVEIDASMHYHTGNFLFDIAFFKNWIDDYIFISPTGNSTTEGLPIYQYKQSNSFLYGGEAGLHFHPKGNDWIHFRSAYSYVVGKQKGGKYLPFIPAQKINVEIAFRKGSLLFMRDVFFTFQPNFALAQNSIAQEETSTDGYMLIDLSFGGTLNFKGQKIQLVIGTSNLLDKKYIDHLSTLKEVQLFNPGRNITFSLRVPFEI